mgnify:CR=1 FL=1
MLLYHPGLKRHHTVSSEHVADSYARSGWERVAPDAAARRASRDELEELAEQVVPDPSRFGSKADLAEALEDES